MKRTLYIPPRRASGFPRSGPGHPYFPGYEDEVDWKPGIDIYDTSDAVVVIVELAGVEPDAVDVTVSGRLLRIRGTRQPRFRPGYRQFHRLEIARGAFERIVELPETVDSGGTEATYRDGFLEIVLPFRGPARPTVTAGRRSRDRGRND